MLQRFASSLFRWFFVTPQIPLTGKRQPLVHNQQTDVGKRQDLVRPSYQ